MGAHLWDGCAQRCLGYGYATNGGLGRSPNPRPAAHWGALAPRGALSVRGCASGTSGGTVRAVWPNGVDREERPGYGPGCKAGFRIPVGLLGTSMFILDHSGRGAGGKPTAMLLAAQQLTLGYAGGS